MFNLSPVVRTLWVFIPVLLPGPQAICAPQYSEASAEIAAKAFCQKLAIPVENSSILKENVDGANPGSIKSEFMAPDQVHLQPRWKIQFPTQVEITVSGVNGQIEGYSNQQFYYRHDLSPSGPAIPREEALQRAMSLLKAAVTPISELTLVEADDVQVSAGARGHRWSLCWRRNYQGIPYAYQYVSVDLVAETGEVINANTGLDLLPPSSTAENVTQEEAINIGQAQLLAAGIQGSTVAWTHKMILQPDTFWQDGNIWPLGISTRTAWLCGFDSGSTTYVVWVETQTGDVIGGNMGGSLGGNKLNVVPAKRQWPSYGHQLTHLEVKKALEKAKA